MKPGFILLEAIIAMLIISMVSLTGLECVRMMNASVARFSATHASVLARRNALALARHLARSETFKSGTGIIAYGAYQVRWRAEKTETVAIRTMTIVGLAPPIPMGLYRVTLVTELQGRAIDQFETFLTAREP